MPVKSKPFQNLANTPAPLPSQAREDKIPTAADNLSGRAPSPAPVAAIKPDPSRVAVIGSVPSVLPTVATLKSETLSGAVSAHGPDQNISTSNEDAQGDEGKQEKQHSAGSEPTTSSADTPSGSACNAHHPLATVSTEDEAMKSLMVTEKVAPSSGSQSEAQGSGDARSHDDSHEAKQSSGLHCSVGQDFFRLVRSAELSNIQQQESALKEQRRLEALEVRRQQQELEVRRQQELEVRRQQELEVRRQQELELIRQQEQEVQMLQEIEVRRQQQELEVRRQQQELEVRRQQQELEVRRHQQELEVRRQQQELEVRRQQELEIRRQQELEVRRQQQELEVRRQQQELEIRRQQQELEVRRQQELDVRRQHQLFQQHQIALSGVPLPHALLEAPTPRSPQAVQATHSANASRINTFVQSRAFFDVGQGSLDLNHQRITGDTNQEQGSDGQSNAVNEK